MENVLAFLKILGIVLVIGGGSVALLFVAVLLWERRLEKFWQASRFKARHIGVYQELHLPQEPAWAVVPRIPEWAALIETGVNAFRREKFSEAAAHAKSADSYSAPLLRFISVNNLAAAYCAEQRYAEAEPLYRHLIDTWYEKGGEFDDGPEVFLGLNNLATALAGQGRYEEAEAVLRHALGLDWKALPRQAEMDAYNLAHTLENLALLYVAKARAYASRAPNNSSSNTFDASKENRRLNLGEARLWAEWALAIREAELGDQHADLVSTLMTLEEVCRLQCEDQDATRFRNRAQLLCEKSFVLDDFDAVARLPRCGLWDSFGRWIEPRSLSERWLLRKFSALNANELLRKVSASKASELEIAHVLDLFATLCVASAQARWMHSTGGYVQADALLWQALQIRVRVLGAEHADVLENRERLGEVAATLGDDRDILLDTWIQDALDYKTRKDGPNDPSLIPTLVRIVDISMTSNWDKAELLPRAIAIAEQAYGRNDPRLVPLLMKLAYFRHNWYGPLDAAEGLYSRALEIVEQTAGADHWNVASILSALGDIYLNLKRPAEAGQCYRRLVALEERVFGPGNFRVQEHLETLAGIGNLIAPHLEKP